MDFADFRLPWGKRHAPVVVLGYSPVMRLYYERQTMRVVMPGLSPPSPTSAGCRRSFCSSRRRW